MYGQTLGESTYGGELPPWRAIVEAGAVLAVQGDPLGLGNPMAQGVGTPDSDGAVLAAPVAIVQTISDASAVDAQALTTAVVIESGVTYGIDAALTLTTAVVVESGPAFTADGAASPIVVAIGTSTGTPGADATLDPVAVAIATGGSSMVIAEADVDIVATAGEAVPIFTPVPPEMAPLIESHEADDLEAELKELFVLMFETYIRPNERYVNVLGMPQHGPAELINQSLANDGLSIYRGSDVASGAGAYLLRAWRSGNPKRGLHLLQTYLQLLWPNVWTADQMWQSKDPETPYPTALSEVDGGDHFLTSRVNVTLPARVTSGGGLNAIQSGLRASLPARMSMNLAIVSEESFGVGIATAYWPGAVAQSYEGSFT